MDKDEKNLFQSCKIGDLQRVKQLVEKEDIELNVRDKWDSTPLYYACLCGHIDLVKYLLENGAKCDANTFDGERCRYGALTDQIRLILRTSKVATARLDQYELFLERLFELGAYSDIVFEINGRLFKLHKAILASRSEYFRRKFEGCWRARKWIERKNEQLVPEAFESVVRYIYTDRFSTLKVHFDACLRLAKMFKLEKLLEQFNRNLYFLNLGSASTNNENGGEGSVEEEPDEIRLSPFNVNERDVSPNPNGIQLTINDTDIFLIGKFGANSKLSTTITIDAADFGYGGGVEKSQLSADLRQLALSCLPPKIRDDPKYKPPPQQLTTNTTTTTTMSDLTLLVDYTHDLCLNLSLANSENAADNSQQQQFRVHKLFLAERCEYFRTFLHDPFNEAATTTKTSTSKVSHLNLKEIGCDVMTEIIFFLYSNDFSHEKLDENILYDVLVVADLYLLPSLKRKCANELITHHLNAENLFDLFRLARIYDLKKLEFACISYMASNLNEFEKSYELKELIIEDAKNLKSRQETDTIDIVDDLRYAINEITSPSSINVASGSSSFDRLVEREKKLNLIDKVLRELNLEC